MPLPDFAAYGELVYSLPERYGGIRHSTLMLVPIGRTLARLEGQIVFDHDTVLDVWELLDFALGRIRNYSYEVYRDGQKVAWYDPFEHPHLLELADTYPHHKHTGPDIKHHRVPAPGICFDRPNLPLLIEDIQRDILGMSEKLEARRSKIEDRETPP